MIRGIECVISVIIVDECSIITDNSGGSLLCRGGVVWGWGLAVAAMCFGNKLSLPTKIYDHDQVNQFTFTC